MLGIFTNDDAGASSDPGAAQNFTMVADWLHSLAIPATFFWVPRPAGFETAHKLWHPVLREARARGHDFQLHGLTHGTCLEFGVPQESTRRGNPKVFEEYESRRDFWDKQHSAVALQSKLEVGATFYREVFGEAPLVFRAPCFGVCAGMYEALAAVGIHISSSRGLNPTATAYTLSGDRALRRWQPDFPCRPWVEPPGVTEIACMEDLCIGGVTKEQYDDRRDLMRSELGHCLEEMGEDGALVFGSHFNSMARTWEQTRPLLEDTISWLHDQGLTRWVTFKDYAHYLAASAP